MSPVKAQLIFLIPMYQFLLTKNITLFLSSLMNSKVFEYLCQLYINTYIQMYIYVHTQRSTENRLKNSISGSSHVHVYIKKHKGQTQKIAFWPYSLPRDFQRWSVRVKRKKKKEKSMPARVSFPNTRGLTATETCRAFHDGAASVKTYLLQCNQGQGMVKIMSGCTSSQVTFS